ncbi:MAG: type III-A CRISPR-associated RAMP protein Csm3 [Petrotogales bacterium]
MEGAEFIGNIKVNAKLVCETGLQIGGNKETAEIGGIDQPVIRDPQGYPYIPGSSLKGKMRTLIEWEKGLVDKDGNVHECDDETSALECPVCKVFGASSDEGYKTGPTRITVRDAHPTDQTIEMWKNLDTDLLYTEWKTENSINRLTSEAKLRQFERVPKGSKFNVEFVFGLYDLPKDDQDDYEFIDILFESMDLLEDSYLGGSGTRGYGKIKFEDISARFVSKEDYRTGEEGKEVDIEKVREDPKSIIQA